MPTQSTADALGLAPLPPAPSPIPSTYRWNTNARRYIDTASGRFVQVSSVSAARHQFIAGQAVQMRGLALQLRAGKISLADWQNGMASSMRQVHLGMAVAARGGVKMMTAKDYGRVGGISRKQYKYLRRFAGQIAAGKVNLDADGFLTRVSMYADAGNRTYWETSRVDSKAAGYKQERRLLGAADHCATCAFEASKGWQPIGSLAPIGNSECLTNCKCEFEYRVSGKLGEDAGKVKPVEGRSRLFAPLTTSAPGGPDTPPLDYADFLDQYGGKEAAIAMAVSTKVMKAMMAGQMSYSALIPYLVKSKKGTWYLPIPVQKEVKAKLDAGDFDPQSPPGMPPFPDPPSASPGPTKAEFDKLAAASGKSLVWLLSKETKTALDTGTVTFDQIAPFMVLSKLSSGAQVWLLAGPNSKKIKAWLAEVAQSSPGALKVEGVPIPPPVAKTMPTPPPPPPAPAPIAVDVANDIPDKLPTSPADYNALTSEQKKALLGDMYETALAGGPGSKPFVGAKQYVVLAFAGKTPWPGLTGKPPAGSVYENLPLIPPIFFSDFDALPAKAKLALLGSDANHLALYIKGDQFATEAIQQMLDGTHPWPGYGKAAEQSSVVVSPQHIQPPPNPDLPVDPPKSLFHFGKMGKKAQLALLNGDQALLDALDAGDPDIVKLAVEWTLGQEPWPYQTAATAHAGQPSQTPSLKTIPPIVTPSAPTNPDLPPSIPMYLSDYQTLTPKQKTALLGGADPHSVGYAQLSKYLKGIDDWPGLATPPPSPAPLPPGLPAVIPTTIYDYGKLTMSEKAALLGKPLDDMTPTSGLPSGALLEYIQGKQPWPYLTQPAPSTTPTKTTPVPPKPKSLTEWSKLSHDEQLALLGGPGADAVLAKITSQYGGLNEQGVNLIEAYIDAENWPGVVLMPHAPKSVAEWDDLSYSAQTKLLAGGDPNDLAAGELGAYLNGSKPWPATPATKTTLADLPAVIPTGSLIEFTKLPMAQKLALLDGDPDGLLTPAGFASSSEAMQVLMAYVLGADDWPGVIAAGPPPDASPLLVAGIPAKIPANASDWLALTYDEKKALLGGQDPNTVDPFHIANYLVGDDVWPYQAQAAPPSMIPSPSPTLAVSAPGTPPPAPKSFDEWNNMTYDQKVALIGQQMMDEFSGMYGTSAELSAAKSISEMVNGFEQWPALAALDADLPPNLPTDLGDWSILTPKQKLALVNGDQDFVNKVNPTYSPGGSDVSSVATLVKYIYGDKPWPGIVAHQANPQPGASAVGVAPKATFNPDLPPTMPTSLTEFYQLPVYQQKALVGADMQNKLWLGHKLPAKNLELMVNGDIEWPGVVVPSPTAAQVADIVKKSKAAAKKVAKKAQPAAAVAPPVTGLDADNILVNGTKTGAAAGSNVGGFYTGRNGKQYYVKEYQDEQQAHGEVIANEIYRALGIGAPVAGTFTHQGKLYYASEIIAGATLDRQVGRLGLTKERADQILDGIVADMLVANIDVVGLTHDNIVDVGGTLYRIDNGSAFLHRAQGGRKADASLYLLTEDVGFAPGPGNRNKSYAKVFEAAGYDSVEAMGQKFVAQVDTLIALRQQLGPQGWGRIVDAHAPAMASLNAADRDKIIKMLDARYKALVEKAAAVRAKLNPPEPEYLTVEEAIDKITAIADKHKVDLDIVEQRIASARKSIDFYEARKAERNAILLDPASSAAQKATARVDLTDLDRDIKSSQDAIAQYETSRQAIHDTINQDALTVIERVEAGYVSHNATNGSGVINTAAVNEAMSKLGRILGDDILSTTTFSYQGSKKDRSYFNPKNGSIHLSTSADWRQAVHEAGHLIEQTNGTIKAEIEAFFKKRIAGETAVELGPPYPPGETAYRDDFAEHYMGKHYDTGETEILAMGIEWMVSRPAELAARDPEMFRLIYRVLGLGDKRKPVPIVRDLTAPRAFDPEFDDAVKALGGPDSTKALLGDDLWRDFQDGWIVGAELIRYHQHSTGLVREALQPTASAAQRAKLDEERKYIGQVVKLRKEADAKRQASIQAAAATATTRTFSTHYEANEWAKQHWASWAQSLTPAQRSAYSSYQGSGYTPMNRHVRMQGEASSTYQAYIRHLDATAFKHPIPFNTTLYRSMGGKNILRHIASGDIVGKVIVDDGYSSSSWSEQFAEGWKQYDSDQVMTEIRVPAGTPAISIDSLHAMGEYEMLLARGTRYKVVKIIERPGKTKKWKLILEVIP